VLWSGAALLSRLQPGTPKMRRPFNQAVLEKIDLYDGGQVTNEARRAAPSAPDPRAFG